MPLGKRQVPPYLSLREDDVTADPASGWMLEVAGRHSTVINSGSPIEGVDQLLAFSLARTFTFPDDLRGRIGLADSSRLSLIVRMLTGNGLYSRIIARKEVDTSVVRVAVTPDRAVLCKVLRIDTQLVLDSPGPSHSELAPRHPGSVVWALRWIARLEGGRSRLPIETVSFSADSRWSSQSRALAHVDVSIDPYVDFEDGICVYLNGDFPLFVEGVARDERAALALLWEAVIRRVIVSFLWSQTGIEDPFGPDSLGRQAERWCAGAFPGRSMDALKRMALEEPSLFEAHIQDWVGIAAELYAEPAP